MQADTRTSKGRSQLSPVASYILSGGDGSSGCLPSSVEVVGGEDQEHLDTDNELIRHVVLGMLAYFAKLQREKISENTKSALARKKAQGVKLGQPSKFYRYRADLVQLMGEGVAKKEMARRTGLSIQTVRK